MYVYTACKCKCSQLSSPTQQRRLFIPSLRPLSHHHRTHPPLRPPIPPQKPQTHNQQAPLQAPRQNKQPPSAPPRRPQPHRKTTRKHETPRRLNTHHGHAQAANRLRPPRRPYLRQVLDGCEQAAEHAEEVCPLADAAGDGVDEDYGAEEGEDEEDEGEGEDEDGFFPRGHFAGGFVGGFGVVAREEDEEEEHAGGMVSMGGFSWPCNITQSGESRT